MTDEKPKRRKPPNAGKGRVKGVPNKATKDVRTAIALVAQNKADDLERWLDQTAEGIKATGKDGQPTDDYLVKPDPGRAAQILLSTIEFHIPRLARAEITGRDGKAIPVQFIPADKAL